MAPVALALPELERLGHDSVASPKVRPLENQFSRFYFLDRLVDSAELMRSAYQFALVVRQRLALRRAKRSCLALDRPLTEVLVAVFGVDLGHDPSHPDLPVQRGPVKRNRDFAVVSDFIGLGAFIVGKEHEAACANFFQKHEAVVGEAVRVDCAETHHVRLDSFLDFSRMREPLLELLERVFIEALGESAVPSARTGRCGTLCVRS